MASARPLSPLRGAGEVAEDEAGPELAATYARLHAALGVPFVPTIFRMLGRWPGYLAAATDALGPVLASPAAEAFARAARARAAATPLPGAPVHAGTELADVLALLDRYNTANPRALLLANALLPGAPAPAGLMAPDAGPRPQLGLLDDVLARHGGFIVPGVWRELAGRPAIAAAAWREVRPLADVPAFHAARAAVRELALAETAGLAAPAPAGSSLAPADRPEVERILSWFAHGIAAVVVEIEHLRRLVRA